VHLKSPAEAALDETAACSIVLVPTSAIIMGRNWCSVWSATDGSTNILGLKIHSLFIQHVDNQENKGISCLLLSIILKTLLFKFMLKIT
jgi:hypothetical protein